jgi:flagellar biosynthesis GTPase FlhF
MENELSVYDKFQAQLAAFKAKDADLFFDVETPEGYADCKKYYGQLRWIRNRVDDLRLDTSKIYRDKVKNINTEGNGIIAEVDAIADPRGALIDAEDAKLQAIIDDKAAEAVAVAAYDEDWRLAHLDNREWDVQVAEDKIKAADEAAQKVIDDAETQRKAAEATAKAVEDTKRQAEQDARDAKTLADEAIAKAKFDAEQKAHKEKGELAAQQLKAANDAQAVVEEADRVKAERVANVKHRTNIHLEIQQSIMPYVKNAANADMLIAAISDGRVSKLEIIY